jgi:uncharacterized membrane protein YphA (DoxX/SURF4 family)
MLSVKHISLNLLRWLFGAVFLFSGLTKAVDPVGTSVFVEKYLMTYGLDALLEPALPIAIALATVELTLGIAVVVNVFHRATLRVALLFVAIFTIITLLSATVLPIGDCGCFGDAVKLSPWATFWKNIALLVVAVVLIRCDSKEYKSSLTQIVVCLVGLLFSLGINLYALRHQPLVDFLPYKVGTDLRTAVAEERSKAAENIKLVFEDKTTGEERLFASTDSDCWLDANLEYVDVRNEAVPDAKFSDFAIYDAEGNDISTALLAQEGRTAWLCVASLGAVDNERERGIASLLEQYPAHAIKVLTSTDTAGEMFGLECYKVDAMTLRSMMRSEIGVIIINSGVVELKADIRDI